MNNTQIQFDFNLPEDDMEFLNNLGFRFHSKNDGRYKWIILKNYPMPNGYNVTTASIAISIPNGYPTNQLDMAYFFPPLTRVDVTLDFVKVNSTLSVFKSNIKKGVI